MDSDSLEIVIVKPGQGRAETGRHFETSDDSSCAYDLPMADEEAVSTDHWFYVDLGALIKDSAYLASIEAFLEDWDIPGMEAYDEL